MAFLYRKMVIPDRLQDIQDKEMYQELMKPGGFLAVPENTGLTLRSDGVDLFKSSQQSFWPILLAVTSFTTRNSNEC